MEWHAVLSLNNRFEPDALERYLMMIVRINGKDDKSKSFNFNQLKTISHGRKR
jgi:hypothetical protein